ncbi:UNVERIFIED_CONTAM: ADP-ribosylglycohydrolase [Williamsia faeni]
MTPIERGLTEAQRDRAAGVLVGTAAGDALGAGYEFTYPTADMPIFMKGGGAFNWAPGEWTDDTSMALCVAEGLTRGRADLDAIAAGFMRWYRSNPPDIGNQTRTVLSAGTVGAAQMADAAARLTGRTGGNGSLMRTAPVALAFLDDLEGCIDAAGSISDLTHFDVRAREACQMWSVGIRYAVLTGSLDGVRLFLDAAPASTSDYWSPLLDIAETGSPADFPNNGWVVHAVQTAWWAITTAGADLPQTLELCVRAGNDTDTTAAIAGGLVGATRGISSIPADWVDLLHGYPGATAADLRALTDKIVNINPKEATP